MLSALRPDLASAFRRAALPLACYYAMTLLVPLLNGAADAEGFVRHAAVVVAVPLLLVALLSVATGGVRRLAVAVRLRPRPAGGRAKSTLP
jgi:hypothetical protein